MTVRSFIATGVRTTVVQRIPYWAWKAMVRFREFRPAPRTTTSNPGSTGAEGERMSAILAGRRAPAAQGRALRGRT